MFTADYRTILSPEVAVDECRTHRMGTDVHGDTNLRSLETAIQIPVPVFHVKFNALIPKWKMQRNVEEQILTYELRSVDPSPGPSVLIPWSQTLSMSIEYVR